MSEKRKFHIPIKSSEEDDASTIYFPVPEDGNFTLDDLRSAFPNAASLRYRDEPASDRLHHILCRDGVFLEPHDGWQVADRVYLAIGNLSSGDARFGLFQSYRNLTSQQRQRNLTNISATTEKVVKNKQLGSTMISVGHGQFKSDDAFSRITSTGLSGCGGIVTVGPFPKTGNTANQIKEAAFEKFYQMNRSFRTKFRSSDLFHLVYPDGSIVEKIPGCSEEFSLIGYRNYVDPSKRFDRLRLYLCTKSKSPFPHSGNFNLNQIEIVSDSNSSSDLPDYFSEQNSSSPNSTLPLTVKIVFLYKENSFQENFPNNTKGSILVQYAKKQLNMENAVITLKCVEGSRAIGNEDRLLEVTTNDTLVVNIETSYTEETNGVADNNDTCIIPIDEEQGGTSDHAIKAAFTDKETSVKIANRISLETIRVMGNTTEPVAVLKTLQKQFLQGRPLDIPDESSTIDGEVSQLFISRYSIYEDAMEEIKYVGNIRFPLYVCFHGENAADYGGPRKEFLNLLLKELKQRLLREDDGTVRLQKESDLLGRHIYFYAGIYIGLSAIEGGPMADFLAVLLESETGEEVDQLKEGIKTTGVLQLFDKVHTIKYLFMTSATTRLTVNKLLSLFSTSMSQEGSNKRRREENSYRHFLRYLREVYTGTRNVVTLEDVLAFVTGSPQIAVLGYEVAPSIEFVDALLPTSATCINRLYLPIEEISFEFFDLAFLNAHFGRE